MRPVKPSVMHDDGDADAANKPWPTVGVDFSVELHADDFAQKDGATSDEPINQSGEQRPLQFPANVSGGWVSLNDLAPPPALFEEQVSQQPRESSEQRVAHPVLHCDAEEHLCHLGPRLRNDRIANHEWLNVGSSWCWAFSTGCERRRRRCWSHTSCTG